MKRYPKVLVNPTPETCRDGRSREGRREEGWRLAVTGRRRRGRVSVRTEDGREPDPRPDGVRDGTAGKCQAGADSGRTEGTGHPYRGREGQCTRRCTHSAFSLPPSFLSTFPSSFPPLFPPPLSPARLHHKGQVGSLVVEWGKYINMGN